MYPVGPLGPWVPLYPSGPLGPRVLVALTTWKIQGNLLIAEQRGYSCLMVGAPASGSRGQGSNPGRGHCVVFLGKTLTHTVLLSTQVYKWVPANLMLAVTLRWTEITSRGSRNTPSLAYGG